MKYIDGFVIPIPKKNVAAYKKMAKAAGKIWMKYGALEYRECVGEDLNVKMGLPFNKMVKIKTGETIIFSWIVYKSRKHRDSVNKKVMADPEVHCDPNNMPFDISRMAYGGFEVLVDYE